MGAELLKMADSLAVVVESLRLLAGIQKVKMQVPEPGRKRR
mgnify:CR=1 FL=1